MPVNLTPIKRPQNYDNSQKQKLFKKNGLRWVGAVRYRKKGEELQTTLRFFSRVLEK